MKVTKIVQYDQVEQLTANGWALVCNVQNQRIDMKRELEQHSHGDGRGNWVPDKYKIIDAVVNETLFVLEKEAGVVEIDRTLQGELNRATDQLRSLRDTNFKHEETVRKLTKERDDVAKACVEITEKRDALKKDHNATNERMHKLEDDLAKVRKAVGELKWAEILGAKS